MSVYQRYSNWYIDFYANGKRVREKVTYDGIPDHKVTKRMADRALEKRKAQIIEGKFKLPNQRIKKTLFVDLAKEYLIYSRANKKSYVRDEQSIKNLSKSFSGKTLNQISPFDIERYKIERKKVVSNRGNQIKESTINRELSCLKNMFNKAINWEMAENNPVNKVKLFKEKPEPIRPISDDEFNALYKEANINLKPILIIAINTGLRLREILNLKWNDIEFNHRYLNVREAKNNELRNIPLNDAVFETIKKIRMHTNPEYVFCKTNGNPIKSIKTAFENAKRRSGVKCRFHDLRHTFASRLVMGGVDLVTTQQLLGHKSLAMTLRYSHPTPEHKKSAVNLLNISPDSHFLVTESNNTIIRLQQKEL